MPKVCSGEIWFLKSGVFVKFCIRVRQGGGDLPSRWPTEFPGLLYSLTATLEDVLEMMQKYEDFLWYFVAEKEMEKCSLDPVMYLIL